ncbi:helix-turn-helix domain-containing protein [Enterococcus villorum]|uniref:Aspartate aminotransferase n=2 Tax=Enterococcus villorum TaxID=112904 RepID=A0A511J4A0_9ENTE|nr:helix-turn-helix domain-containing protein [Enterococcus villorum]EOH91997.1 hypothetical protein UAO_00668 [Enterococcus villorum ATCC 700913]EOW76713.1 hypothetical protein I591_02021 [Enterococcus villorum ATCC 700913]GEL92519.1 aspartate aminotransferase [Enterococcus villorum]
MDYRFFGKDCYIKSEILRVLYGTDEWQTTNKIANKLGIGSRTAFRHINELELEIKKFKNKKLSLIIKQGRGIRLLCEEPTLYKMFISYLCSQSITMRLISQLLEKKMVSQMSLLNEFFVSETTLKRHLKFINSYLKEYHVEILLKRGNVYLKGDEYSIRAGFYRIYWQIFGLLEWPFKSLNKRKLSDFLSIVAEVYQVQLNPSTQLQLMFVLAINILRFRSKNEIQISTKYIAYFEITKSFPISAEVMTKWLRELYMSRKELFFFLLYLQTRVSFYKEERVLETFLQQHKNLNTPVYQQTEKVIDFINTLAINTPEFISSSLLAAHLHVELFPCFKKDISGMYLVGGEQSPSELQFLAQSLAQNFVKEVGCQSYLTDIYLYFLHTTDPQNSKSEIQIFVDTDLVFIQEQKLMAKIKKLLNEFHPVNVYKYTGQALTNNQLIFSNYYLPENLISTYREQILFIENEFSLNDLQNCIEKVASIVTDLSYNDRM